MEAAVRIDALVRQWIGRIAPDSPAAYAFATVLVALAALLRFILGPFGTDVLPLLTFYPATLFAAFVGGWRPGLYAAVLGGMIGWWAFFTPSYTFFPLTPGEVVSLLIYAGTSLVVVFGADHHRSLIERLRREEEFRQMVVDELSHRLKNKVATIQSIVGYQLRDNPELKDAISRRLGALSATDDLIMAAQGKGALLHDIVSTELRPYQRSRTLIEGPRIMLDPKLALSMALVVHELATNAAKHGALSAPEGRISMRWLAVSGPESTVLTVEWLESGGPAVTPPARLGFGLRLLSIALEQFNGTIDALFEPAGLVCRMRVPLPTAAHPSGEAPLTRPLAAPSGQSLTPGHPSASA